MNPFKRLFLFSPVLLVTLLRVDAQENTQPQTPPKYKMELVHIVDTEETEYIFVIGNTGFKSVDSLKKFLASLPAGSELEWAPGCIRMGNEPLLSSDQDMEEFKEFCVQKNIKLVLVPSG